MAREKQDFPDVQSAMGFIAAQPTMDELMARRAPSLGEIRLMVKMWRAQRVIWQNAADLRRDKKDAMEAEGDEE